jgi:hypothetical protein
VGILILDIAEDGGGTQNAGQTLCLTHNDGEERGNGYVNGAQLKLAATNSTAKATARARGVTHNLSSLEVLSASV